MDLHTVRSEEQREQEQARNGERGIGGVRLDAMKRMKERRGGH